MAKRIIIPARYGSTRLPAKLLIPIAGKSILQHTYERALECGFDSVLIATDDERIAALAEGINAPYCMTDIEHTTGTDRCAEAMALKGYADDDIIINLQGDEPLIPVANVLEVALNLEAHPEVEVATLCEELIEKGDIFNPNYVKVVFNQENHALYFSRAPIPWARDAFPGEMSEELFFYRHIGLYAYRGRFLRAYPKLHQNPLERLEKLEQLRVLWHGYKIHVDIAPENNPPGVDTASSLQEVKLLIERGISFKRS
ncbi:MAG: 3-deoxy-manno-octulosonate cytidylyltransferase [Gammaproteobacteria bacterium]|nr:3-deoxy-manno-octulosonate cytidylyltransferase [Gammaproteobacteria bacterium]